MSNSFERAIENLIDIEVDAGIARRLREDIDLVNDGDDVDLVAALERVIRFLDPVAAQSYASPARGEPA